MVDFSDVVDGSAREVDGADLLPYDTIAELAKLYAAGARKYAPRNWEKGIAFDKNINAALRHIAKRAFGETVDPETNVNHLVAAAWNLIAQATFDLRGTQREDCSVAPNKAIVDMLSVAGQIETDSNTGAMKQGGKVDLFPGLIHHACNLYRESKQYAQ